VEKLTGKVFVLLGATSGISIALARRLFARDSLLHIVGRRESELQSLASKWGATYSVADATAPDEIEAALVEAKQQHASIHGVVNCYGSMLLKPAHLTSLDEWRQTMDINATSSFVITRAASKLFSKEGGSVVLVSSVAARTGLANHEAIAAAKAAVIGLALSAAATYASKHIRFNVVAPGLTRTPLTEKITSNEAALKASIQMHPLGRIGEPEEVASAIEWFLDPQQSWVTGQVLGVDGGLGSVRSRMSA